MNVSWAKKELENLSEVDEAVEILDNKKVKQISVVMDVGKYELNYHRSVKTSQVRVEILKEDGETQVLDTIDLQYMKQHYEKIIEQITKGTS